MKQKFRKQSFSSGPLPMRYVLLLTVACFVFITALSIWLVNGEIRPTLMQYADAQTRKIATLAINNAVKEKIAQVDNLDEVITDMPSQTGSIQFDTQQINTLLTDMTDAIQANLAHIERGELKKLEKQSGIPLHKGQSDGIVYSIPLGLASKNAILANVGPAIPIEFTVIGDVETDVVPEIKPYGINNAMVKIILKATVRVSMIVPFSTKETTVTTNVPIAIGMIQGKVPDFYNGTIPNVGSPK